jgi:hypothetical protein
VLEALDRLDAFFASAARWESQPAVASAFLR